MFFFSLLNQDTSYQASLTSYLDVASNISLEDYNSSFKVSLLSSRSASFFVCELYLLVPQVRFKRGLQLRHLDLEYCARMEDNAIQAIASHCHQLSRLQLTGCVRITDAAILGPNDDSGRVGLAEGCPQLRRLLLRGCREITDAGMLKLAQGCSGLRELCLSGCPNMTAPAIARVLASAKKLVRLKVELWQPQSSGGRRAAAAAGAGGGGGGGGGGAGAGAGGGAGAAAAAGGDGGRPSSSRPRAYRLIGSVPAAVRYLKASLAADDPTLVELLQRFRLSRKPTSG